jgi:hypothetical protein
MRKIIERATSWAFLYLRECVGTFISFSGSPRLCPFYLKLSQARHLRIADASPQQEGLGATYDKRKWNESYYGKPRSRNKLFLR